VFGVLSAVGVVVGSVLANWAAASYGPGKVEPMREMAPWAVGFGLVGGHFMHVFGYHPELLREDPWVVVRIWEGLSSMGGVLGALVGIAIAFRRMKVPLLPYLDALALGAAPGWAIARVGCFLVHDHPGVPTTFPLAVRFPAALGGPRHDLGLYDVLVLLGLSVLLFVVARTRPGQGRLMGLLAVGYCACRFGLDFLRATDLSFVDRRYAGLTPAQYVVAGLFCVGVWLLARPTVPLSRSGTEKG
jgi:phosphatidylglycerol:prolipoprotein diacylglycerol transferase